MKVIASPTPMLSVPTKHQLALKEWIPLHRAVFAWAFNDDSKKSTANKKPIFELTDDEIAEIARKPPSKTELEELLKEKTGAEQALIDTATATFQFCFRTSSGAMAAGGPPWSFLRSLPADFVEPTGEIVELSAVVKSGLVRIESDDPNRDGLIRQAVGLVWRQLMLRPFDRAITSGDITLFARPQSVSQEFKVLPSDIWPVLEIVDWENGVASAPDGTIYWSIHVQVNPSIELIPNATESVPASEKRGWKRRSAKRAISALYPNEVPPELPNKILCKCVNDWLRNQGEPEVDQVTILRAANRRQN